MSIKELRLEANMNRKQFSDYFRIPYRTVEDWEAEKAKCAPYLFDLMRYKLEHEGLVEHE